MNRLAFRRAAAPDVDALVGLERGFPGDRLSRRSFRRLLGRPSAEVWVCSAGGQIIGSAVVLHRANSRAARLYSLIVAPAARGRGVATALIDLAEASARSRGCERVRLEVRCDNTAALGLYRKRGYRVVARLPRFYDDGQSALRLERAPLDDVTRYPNNAPQGRAASKIKHAREEGRPDERSSLSG